MKTRDMILISMFAALTAIGAFIKFQIGVVPFTLQFFFLAFAGVFLGAKKGLYSQLLYVGMGLVGLPIFTNGGGPTYIFQPTFGFLLGYIVCAYVIGFITERMGKLTVLKVFLAVAAGLIPVYVIGVPYLYMIVKLYLGSAEYTFMSAVKGGFLPFIGPDLVKSFVIASVAVAIVPQLRRMGIGNEIKARG